MVALGRASELFVTNSNVGVVPVTQVDQVQFPIGPETQTLVAFVPPVSAR